MSSKLRLPANPKPYEGYKSHSERWASLVEPAEPVLIELRETSAEPAEARRELPASIVYWTVGLALGALLLGLSTRPGLPLQEPLPDTRIVSATIAEPVSASEQAADEPTFMIVLDPPIHRTRVVAGDLEAELKDRLARRGFPNIGVSVSHDDSVYLAGTLFEQSEKGEIVRLVKSTPGVAAIHFAQAPVRKLYGPAYFGADTAPHQGGGVEVSRVWEGSPAEMAGIRAGDVIDSFGNLPVSSSDSLRYMVMSHVGGQRVEVSITRSGQQQNLTVRLGELPALASK